MAAFPSDALLDVEGSSSPDYGYGYADRDIGGSLVVADVTGDGQDDLAVYDLGVAVIPGPIPAIEGKAKEHALALQALEGDALLPRLHHPVAGQFAGSVTGDVLGVEWGYVVLVEGPEGP